MSVPPPPGLSLIGDLTAWALWGFYFSLFCATLYILCIKPRTGMPNRILLASSIAIFFFTTSEVILLSNRLYVGLIASPNPEAQYVFFLGTGPAVYAAAIVMQLCNVLTADAVLTWRTWVVWNRRWPIIIFNIILWFVTLGTSVYISIIAIQVSTIETWSPTDPIMVGVIHWTMVVQSLTLTQNLLATSLIASRLWAIDRATAAYKQSSLMPLVWMFVESGAFYTAFWIEELASSAVVSTPGQYCLSQLVCPVIGVTFSLITVRVGLGLTRETSSAQSTMPHSANTVLVNVQRNIDVEREARDDANSGAGDDASFGVGDGGDMFKMESLGRKTSHIHLQIPT